MGSFGSSEHAVLQLFIHNLVQALLEERACPCASALFNKRAAACKVSETIARCQRQFKIQHVRPLSEKLSMHQCGSPQAPRDETQQAMLHGDQHSKQAFC